MIQIIQYIYQALKPCGCPINFFTFLDSDPDGALFLKLVTPQPRPEASTPLLEQSFNFASRCINGIITLHSSPITKHNIFLHISRGVKKLLLTILKSTTYKIVASILLISKLSVLEIVIPCCRFIL